MPQSVCRRPLMRIALQDEDVIALLKMVSGEEMMGIPEVITWDMRTTVHVENDPQRERLAKSKWVDSRAPHGNVSCCF